MLQVKDVSISLNSFINWNIVELLLLLFEQVSSDMDEDLKMMMVEVQVINAEKKKLREHLAEAHKDTSKDELAELRDEMSLSLQAVLERRSKLFEALSNFFKKGFHFTWFYY